MVLLRRLKADMDMASLHVLGSLLWPCYGTFIYVFTYLQVK